MKVKNVVVKILPILVIWLHYSYEANADASAGQKSAVKVVKVFDCEGKKVSLENYELKHGPTDIDHVEHIILGDFFNSWVAYRESHYYGEANRIFLINKKSCDKFQIDGENIVALNNNTFLTWSLDFEAGFIPNQISMFAIEGNKVIKTGEFIPPKGGPENAKWINKDLIKFRLVDFNPDTEAKEKYIYQDKIIVRRGSEWVYKTK